MYQTRTHKRGILMLLCLMASFLGYSQDNGKLPIAPAEARQTAIKDLNKTLQWITPEYLEQYGFEFKDDLSAITVGIPMYQHSFDAEALTNETGGKELHTDMVLLPLRIDDAVRCFIYLMPDKNGNWVVSGIGGANEARTWSPVINRAEKQYDHLSTLHLVQNNADYLLAPASGNYENISVGQFSYGQEQVLQSLDELYSQAVRVAREARKVTGDMSN